MRSRTLPSRFAATLLVAVAVFALDVGAGSRRGGGIRHARAGATAAGAAIVATVATRTLTGADVAHFVEGHAHVEEQLDEGTALVLLVARTQWVLAAEEAGLRVDPSVVDGERMSRESTHLALTRLGLGGSPPSRAHALRYGGMRAPGVVPTLRRDDEVLRAEVLADLTARKARAVLTLSQADLDRRFPVSRRR